MLYNLRTKLKCSWHNLNCRAIFETEPLRIQEAPLLFLSMVSHDDDVSGRHQVALCANRRGQNRGYQRWITNARPTSIGSIITWVAPRSSRRGASKPAPVRAEGYGSVLWACPGKR